MITRIVCYFLFPMLIIALFLSFAGVNRVEFGNSYYEFIASVNKNFERWVFSIPEIPKIKDIEAVSYDSKGVILKVLIKIANGFFWVVNAFSSVVNVLITIMNVLIHITQFILTLIYQCKDFINKLRQHIRFAYV